MEIISSFTSRSISWLKRRNVTMTNDRSSFASNDVCNRFVRKEKRKYLVIVFVVIAFSDSEICSKKLPWFFSMKLTLCFYISILDKICIYICMYILHAHDVIKYCLHRTYIEDCFRFWIVRKLNKNVFIMIDKYSWD